MLPDYASKAFRKARDLARSRTCHFSGLAPREMPTLHEIRALASHLYAKVGYQLTAVQELMAHTDPDMTKAYQKGHARKILRVDMMLPFNVPEPGDGIREQPAIYQVSRLLERQEIFSENSLTKIRTAA